MLGGISTMLPYGKNLKHLARDLRKGQTDAEQRLWSHIHPS